MKPDWEFIVAWCAIGLWLSVLWIMLISSILSY